MMRRHVRNARSQRLGVLPSLVLQLQLLRRTPTWSRPPADLRSRLGRGSCQLARARGQCDRTTAATPSVPPRMAESSSSDSCECWKTSGERAKKCCTKVRSSSATLDSRLAPPARVRGQRWALGQKAQGEAEPGHREPFDTHPSGRPPRKRKREEEAADPVRELVCEVE